MPVPYEVGGRSNQKQRTRAALVAATREIVAQGGSPTVEEAATAARISRTTAYRYFATQSELLAAAHPEIERVSLLPDDPPADPARRLELVVHAYTQMTLRSERQYRAMLRLSLTDAPPELPLRQGRVIGWLEDALSPLQPRLGAAAVHRLALQIRSATGIESFVWLVDIGGLGRTAAIKLMRESARALLAAAL